MARFGQAFFGDGSRFGVETTSGRKFKRTMASNPLPGPNDKLFALASRMINGLHDLEVTIGIKQNTEAVLTASLSAAESSEAAFGNAKTERKEANGELTKKDGEGKTFIGNARKRLAKFFGERPSTEWEGAGWPSGSTSTPTTQDERFALIKSVKAYFTLHPEHASADMEATAALAQAAWQAIDDARGVFDTKVTDMGTAKAARDTAVKNLRDRMTGLIGELDTVLEDDDPRWHKFGLSRPSDPEMPEPPTFTTAIAGVPGTGLIDWDDPPRAEHFRVWIWIIGVDQDFHAVESPADSDATLSSLPSGATVKVRVTSVNAAGESQPGPEAQFVVL